MVIDNHGLSISSGNGSGRKCKGLGPGPGAFDLGRESRRDRLLWA